MGKPFTIAQLSDLHCGQQFFLPNLLERAIVEWDLPLSKTRATIEALHPDLFDEIFEHISWGEPPADNADPTPPPPPQPASDEPDS